ncbi:MAG TPA: hypothetical protein DEO84_02170 [candidate division Zixibacteria bacterium]|nr:hypothetical protein [candidate division Zixibacteria bacterium]HBZ00103.1 hypothetical protein [candidate division Zixibacteria bacterium]
MMEDPNAEMAMNMPGELPPVEPGFGQKLILAFTNPIKLFESIQRQSSWLPPLIAIILVSIIAGLIAQPYIMPSVRQETMAYLSKIPNMPEDAIAKANEQFDKSSELTAKGVAMTVVGSILMRTAAFFVVVTAIFLMGAIFFGGTAKYIKVMSMYAWVLPIWILGILIVTPLMIIKGSHAVSLSPAVIMPSDPFNSIYFFLKNLSFFNIWAVIVAGIGISVIYGITRAKGIIVMLILWGIWIVINSFIPFLNFQMAISGLT